MRICATVFQSWKSHKSKQSQLLGPFLAELYLENLGNPLAELIPEVFSF